MNAREGTVSHDVWQGSNLTLGLEVCAFPYKVEWFKPSYEYHYSI